MIIFAVIIDILHHMRNLTVTILTYNEERRIEQCLRSVEGVADEVVVVDSYSTDRTVEICRAHGCRVRQRHLSGYGAQRQYATSLAHNDYILALDADEALSPELAQAIRDLKRNDFGHRVYRLSRLNFYCGRPVRHCGWYPDCQIRLFDRRYANWNLSEVSEQVMIFRDSVCPEPVPGDILHFRCDTPEAYAVKERHHALMMAQALGQHRQSIGMWRPTLEGLRAFVACYFGRSGIADGLTGLAISAERFRCARLAWSTARRYQLNHPTTLTT